MTIIPQFINEKSLQSLADNHALFYGRKTAQETLATLQGPNINPLVGAGQCI